MGGICKPGASTYCADARSESVARLLLLSMGNDEGEADDSWVVECGSGGRGLAPSFVVWVLGREERMNLLEMNAWMLLATCRLAVTGWVGGLCV